MSLGVLTTLFSKLSLLGAEIIKPAANGSSFGMLFGKIMSWLGQGFCLAFYGLVKWMLAFVDFMQYFVQKLIGLDYWLNGGHYTLEGAVESDIIFGFLYNDTVQKVFRAMIAIFFVLLIIFTIYAIIKSEWEHIAGKGGKFGDGVGNSKNKIFKSSLKAIAMVMIFPIILMVGIISTNAILASLIKALNIDTSSTLGGQIFQIASQTANKHQIYAQGDDGRVGVSDQVSFYIYNGKYLTMKNPQGDTALVESADTYEEFLTKVADSTKYTVNSVFQRIDMGRTGSQTKFFYGYLAKITDAPYFIMVTCNDGAKPSELNSKEGYYYYLRNVLQVPIVTRSQSFGFAEHKEIKKEFSTGQYEGYISGLNLARCYNYEKGSDVASACNNTWNYASVYAETFDFEEGVDYVRVMNNAVYGLDGITASKLFFNSSKTASYIDGGMFGVAQLQAEYMVMSEVINFINQNDFRLHVLDATSELIDWSGHGSYHVDEKWVSLTAGYEPDYKTISDGKHNRNGTITNVTDQVLPFVVSYSDNCNETEMGNALYFAKKGIGDELNGSKFIMCIKVENASGNAKYIPLVNNKTYTDPITGKMYNFKSDYYTSSYHGVVVAKGLMDSTASSTNLSRGEPTYLRTNSSAEVDGGAAYYFDTELTGTFNQFGDNLGLVMSNEDYLNSHANNSFKVDSVTLSSLNNEQYSYRVTDKWIDDGTGTGTKISSPKLEYVILQYQTGTEPDAADESLYVTPNIDHISNIVISLKRGTDTAITAEYTGQSNGEYYLFTYLDGSKGYNFIVHVSTASACFEIMSYTEIDPNNLPDDGDEYYKWQTCEDAANLNATTYYYNVKYDFVSDSVNAIDVVLYEEFDNVDPPLPSYKFFTPNYFVYSKGDIFSTVDMHSTDPSIVNKTCYFNIRFNSANQQLVTLNVVNGEPSIHYAEMYEPGATLAERNADNKIQRVQTLKFKMYDFYTFYNSSSHTLRQYELNGTIGAASDSIRDIEANIDSNDFFFAATDTQLHLYNGKTYVATIYKYSSSRPEDVSAYQLTNISEIATKTAYIKLEGVDFYNIRTQNSYKYETEAAAIASAQPYERNQVAELHYADMQSSAVIQCVRDNRKYTFMDMDFAVATVIPLKFRFKLVFFVTRMGERAQVSYEVKLTEGIKFDYFFADSARNEFGNGMYKTGYNKITLSMFYVPSEISYWIIIISCLLMIKVLGTAIWGVIKRIYEITLFFIAMPAVASTIPLDDGARFDSSITKPLIGKVFSTYGTMLGINVFFILLYPVKSLSQIFTAADIATADSYFLRNFMNIFKNYQLRADMLNLYVYILFVLVAFTMISSLPNIITQMMGTGGEDISKSGEAVKKDAMGTLKSSLDTMSGKSLADGVGKAVNWAQETLPGRAISGIVNKFKKDKSSVSDDTGEETPEGEKEKKKSKEEEEEEAVQGEIDDAVKEATGGKYNTYADAMASGDEAAMKAAETARQQVENDITGEESTETGEDGQPIKTTRQRALERIKAREAEEGETETEGEGPESTGEKAPEQRAEDIARKAVEGDIESVAAIAGVDAGQMQTNAAKGMVASGAPGSSAIIKSAFAKNADGSPLEKGKTADISDSLSISDEAKEQAVLSTLNPDQRKTYEAMNAKQRKAFLSDYDVQATVDSEGNVTMTAGKKGGEMKKVGDSAANAIMAASLTGEQVAEAAKNEDVSKSITAFAAGNIAAAVGFEDPNSAVADRIVKGVMGNPEDKQNGAVIDQAIMDMLNADPAKLKTFMKFTGLTAEQVKDPEQFKAAIAKQRKGGLTLDNLGIKPEDYQSFMPRAIQESVANGSFKLSAWDMAKASTPTAVAELVEKAQVDNMIKTSDELELEEQKSRELAQNASAQALLQTMLSTGNIDPEKVSLMFEKFAGLDDIDPKEAEKIVQDSNLTADQIKNLGFENDNIGLAKLIKMAELTREGGATIDNLQALAQTQQNNPQALSKQLLEGMMTKTGDMKGVEAMLSSEGPDAIFTSDEIGELKTAYASSAFAGMSKAEREKFMQKTGMSEEEASKLSLFEVEALKKAENPEDAARIRRETYDALHKENKMNKAIDAAIESQGVTPEQLKAYIDGQDISPEEKEAYYAAYSTKMRLVTEADESKAEGQATREALLESAVEKELVDENGKPLEGAAREKKKKELEEKYKSKSTEELLAIVSLTDDDVKEGKTEERVKEVEEKVKHEATSRMIADIRDRVGGKKFESAMKAWKKKNKTADGKEPTDEQFFELILSGKTSIDGKEVSGDAATIFGGKLDKSKIDAIKASESKYRQQAVVAIAQETIDGFGETVETRTSELVEKENQRRIKAGEADVAFAFADAFFDENDKSPDAVARRKQAIDLYKQMYGGDLENTDEFVRAAFLHAQFFGKEGFKDITEKAKTAKGISASRVAAVHDFMTSYDGGEEGNKFAQKIKRSVMAAEIERNGGIENVQLAIDPEKLDGAARKRFELNQSILQSEIRANPQVLVNLFNNNTILGQDKIIADLAAAQGITLNYDENGRITGGSYENEKGETVNLDGVNAIKEHLSEQAPEAIIAYMNSHEETKNTLVNIGAQNMVTALDAESQDAKKVDAILNSPYLRSQVTDETLKQVGVAVDKNGQLDKNEIENLIRQMLEAEGRLSGNEEKDAKFIEEHFAELKTEVALHFGVKRDKNNQKIIDPKTGKFVYEFNAAGKNPEAFIGAMKGLEQKTSDGKPSDFAMNLNREVTQMLDPSRYDPETSTQEFFAARSIDEFITQDNEDFAHMSGAIDRFFSKGFKGFSKKTRVVREKIAKTVEGSRGMQEEAMRELVTDDDLYKNKKAAKAIEAIKLNDDDRVKYAQQDAYMRARLGNKINDRAAVLEFLNNNKKESDRIEKAAKLAKFKESGDYTTAVHEILLARGQASIVGPSREELLETAMHSGEVISAAASAGVDIENEEQLHQFLMNNPQLAAGVVKTINAEKVKDGTAEYVLESHAIKSYVKKTDRRAKRVEQEKLDEMARGEKGKKKADEKAEKAAEKQEKKTRLQVAREQQRSEVFVRDGKFADKTVENIELYNEFMSRYNSATTKTEKRKLLDSVGGKLDYDSVMLGLSTAQHDEKGNRTGGWALRTELQQTIKEKKAREAIIAARKAKAKKGETVDENVSQEDIDKYLSSKRHQRQMNRQLRKKRDSVAGIVGEDLRREAVIASVSDKQILAYAAANENAVNDDELLEAAKTDAFMLAKFGDVTSTWNREEVLAAIKGNDKHKNRLTIAAVKKKKDVVQAIYDGQVSDEHVFDTAKQKGIKVSDDDLRRQAEIEMKEKGEPTGSVEDYINANKTALQATVLRKKMEDAVVDKYLAGKKQNNTEYTRVRRARIQTRQEQSAMKSGLRSKRRYERSVTSRLKRGGFAHTTAENIRLFNELEKNKELRDKVVEAVGGEEKYNYETVVDYLSLVKGQDVKKQLVTAARRTQARVTLGDKVKGMDDAAIDAYLAENYFERQKVDRSIRSSKGGSVAGIVGQGLREKIVKTVLPGLDNPENDPEILDYAKKNNITVSEADMIAQAEAMASEKLGRRVTVQETQAYLEANRESVEKAAIKKKVVQELETVAVDSYFAKKDTKRFKPAKTQLEEAAQETKKKKKAIFGPAMKSKRAYRKSTESSLTESAFAEKTVENIEMYNAFMEEYNAETDESKKAELLASVGGSTDYDSVMMGLYTKYDQQGNISDGWKKREQLQVKVRDKVRASQARLTLGDELTEKLGKNYTDEDVLSYLDGHKSAGRKVSRALRKHKGGAVSAIVGEDLRHDVRNSMLSDDQVLDYVDAHADSVSEAEMFEVAKTDKAFIKEFGEDTTKWNQDDVIKFANKKKHADRLKVAVARKKTGVIKAAYDGLNTDEQIFTYAEQNGMSIEGETAQSLRRKIEDQQIDEYFAGKRDTRTEVSRVVRSKLQGKQEEQVVEAETFTAKRGFKRRDQSYLKKGTFARKTVENVEMYNAFMQKYNEETDESKKAELLASVGGKLDYDSVMLGLNTKFDENGQITSGWTLKEQLQKKVKAQKARDLYRDEIRTATGLSEDRVSDDAILTWLSNNKTRDNAVNKALRGKKNSVAKVAGAELRHEALNASLSDKQVLSYVDSNAGSVTATEVYEAAKADKFMLERFGTDPSKWNQTEVLEFISDSANGKHLDRLKVSAARKKVDLVKTMFDSQVEVKEGENAEEKQANAEEKAINKYFAGKRRYNKETKRVKRAKKQGRQESRTIESAMTSKKKYETSTVSRLKKGKFVDKTAENIRIYNAFMSRYNGEIDETKKAEMLDSVGGKLDYDSVMLGLNTKFDENGQVTSGWELRGQLKQDARIAQARVTLGDKVKGMDDPAIAEYLNSSFNRKDARKVDAALRRNVGNVTEVVGESFRSEILRSYVSDDEILERREDVLSGKNLDDLRIQAAMKNKYISARLGLKEGLTGDELEVQKKRIIAYLNNSENRQVREELDRDIVISEGRKNATILDDIRTKKAKKQPVTDRQIYEEVERLGLDLSPEIFAAAIKDDSVRATLEKQGVNTKNKEDVLNALNSKGNKELLEKLTARVVKKDRRYQNIVQEAESRAIETSEDEMVESFFTKRRSNNTEKKRVHRAKIQRAADETATEEGLVSKRTYETGVTSSLRSGSFAGKSVENVMMFNELEQNTGLREEVVRALNGRAYNYDNVMQVITENDRFKYELSDAVKVRKLRELAGSDEVLASKIKGKKDSELLEFLSSDENKKYAKKVTESLESTKKADVVKEIRKNDLLVSEARQSRIQDRQIEEYIKTHEERDVKVETSEIIEEAQRDARFMGKLKAKGITTREGVEKYLTENSDEAAKYKQKVRMRKLREDSDLMSEVFISVRREEPKTLTEEDYRTYAKKHNISIKANKEELRLALASRFSEFAKLSKQKQLSTMTRGKYKRAIEEIGGVIEKEKLQALMSDTTIATEIKEEKERELATGSLSDGEIDRYFNKKRASNSKRYKRSIKPIEEQFAYKWASGVRKFGQGTLTVVSSPVTGTQRLIKKLKTPKAKPEESVVTPVETSVPGSVETPVAEAGEAQESTKRKPLRGMFTRKKPEQKPDDIFVQRKKFSETGFAQGGWTLLRGTGKGLWTGIKYTGIGAWYGVKGVGVAAAETGKGIGRAAVVGANGVAFAFTKKLPKMCSQYENWNKIIEHKITEVKNSTKLTRAEKEKQIRIFESQKIYLEKPKGYSRMTPEEQNAFDLEQDKLKRSAYTNKGLVKYLKTIEKVGRVKDPSKLGLPAELIYTPTPAKGRKNKHLEDFRQINEQARRFRATAAMRNHQRDFGDEFEDFARSFMTKKRYFDMVKRYKLKSAIEYQKLSAQEKEKERRRREEAMASQIVRLQRTVGKKVARDNKLNKKSFLAERGISDDLLRYKNSMTKFRDNPEQTTKLGKHQIRHLKDEHKIATAQNQAAIADRTMQELMKFCAGYKGSSADFASELKKHAAQLGVDNKALIDKIYKKYASLFKGGLGRLEHSPIAVQQRKIMESLMAELKKCKRRIEMNGRGNIPAALEIANTFVGKSFSNSRSQVQKQINKQQADEYSRIVKLIKEQKNLVSFDSLKSRIPQSLLEEFRKKYGNMTSKSESAKKAALETFFEKRLKEALIKVHNDQYSRSDRSQLERLNGRRVKKSEIDHSKHSSIIREAMKTADNPVYQKIVREYNSAAEKVKLEKFNYDELYATLTKLKYAPRTPENITRTIQVKKSLEQSKIKLRRLQKLLDAAQTQKRDYEQSFARTQIREAKSVSKALGYSRGDSVLDRYNFIKTDGSTIVKGTQDAKQVQMLVSNYIQQYRQTIESMIARRELVGKVKGLEAYLKEMRTKFTADFGRNMKYSRELKEQLTKKIKELAEGSEDARQMLNDSIQNLTKSEETLKRKFTDMSVKVDEISLKR